MDEIFYTKFATDFTRRVEDKIYAYVFVHNIEPNTLLVGNRMSRLILLHFKKKLVKVYGLNILRVNEEDFLEVAKI